MKVAKSAGFSFFAMGVIYCLTGALGVILYEVLPFAFYWSLLIADVVCTVFVFVFSLIFKNASVYDPYWSVQPPVIMTAFLIKRGFLTVMPWEIAVLVAVWYWAIRLTVNWGLNFQDLTHQDWRYTMLAEKTGKLYPFVNFVGIHMVPTLVVYACTLPTVFMVYENLSGNAFTYVFAGLAVGFATLQLVSDLEMRAFRKNRTGAFIRTGLWKYARHPNYLGEIGMWWSVALAVVIPNPDRWYLLLGAALNTLLFLCVSIPLADGKQSKKEGFAAYKRETHALLPFPKLIKK